jgi:alpha-L-fucosidase
MKRYFFSYSFLLICISSFSQSKVSPDSIANKMQWFADAKLGIFIHWGIYSVNGIDESWSFYNKKITHEDYMKQLNGFTASHYKPEEWAALIREAGARYAVITTKHHDGVALWPSREGHYNVIDNTPAKKDVLLAFYKALDKQGIKRGAYYSLLDWSHPDYPGFLNDSNRYKIPEDGNASGIFSRPRSVKLILHTSLTCGGLMAIGSIVLKNGKVQRSVALFYNKMPLPSSTAAFKAMVTMKHRNKIFL